MKGRKEKREEGMKGEVSKDLLVNIVVVTGFQRLSESLAPSWFSKILVSKIRVFLSRAVSLSAV